MRKIGIVAVSVLAICFIAFIISGLAGGQKESGVYYNEFATRLIKEYDEYSSVLNAETVSKSYIHKNIDLRKKFNKKKYKNYFIAFVEPTDDKSHTSKLYNENGCYLSICYATYFNVAENRTTDILQCFIFTKDLEEAGSILFLRNDIESMNVSINDTEVGGSSIVLETLAEGTVTSYDNEHNTYYEFEHNGTDYHYYESNDKDFDDKVIWYEDGYVFGIYAHLPKDELIKIAENIEK